MKSWFSEPMKAHTRLEFSKDEDIEFFICQNILSMPQLIIGQPDYLVSHHNDYNTICIYDITEDNKDLLVKHINEYAKQMRDQGIEKIKEAFRRF